jgi:hypothetical protein
LDKVVLHRKHKQALRGVHVMRSETQRLRHGSNASTAVGDSELARLAAVSERVRFARGGRTERLGARARHKLANHGGAAVGVLRKRHLIDNVVFAQHHTAADARVVAACRIYEEEDGMCAFHCFGKSVSEDG